MKTLLIIISVLSFNTFANEGLKEQIINKKVQENISNKIHELKAIDVKVTSLNEYVTAEENTCLKLSKGDIALESVCLDNSQRLYAIGDIETIIDTEIAKLTEYQTSFYVTYIMMSSLEPNTAGKIVIAGALLPITLTIDLILSPFILFIF